MATLSESATPAHMSLPAGPTTPPASTEPETLGKTNPNYKHLTPSDVDHFLTKGWLHVPGAIKTEYIDRWMKDLYVRVGYDEHDKSTWEKEYLHLPRHREVPAEEFCPEAWNKIVEIAGGEHMVDPIRERYYGDAFIINFGSEEKAKIEGEPFTPNQRSGWHTDCDWYRQFLDATGNAMTLIHCFTDIPARGGGTWLCEDGLAGESTARTSSHSLIAIDDAPRIEADFQLWCNTYTTHPKASIPLSPTHISHKSRPNASSSLKS